eukprot:gnl/TRDRNA2_/TRDRNA2_83822_c0_seq3.p1 gnl/TRDRNA2_/TRDRNA2_83822_c0~~gnl/TRDRNA2_/TRDRNA2_83822_c0_seq3.p1  ORF type:complete len:242 (+),score=35.78 gnl/TRDRNA2_/TRDRNA2_83822_c0_seq3:79-804(+)
MPGAEQEVKPPQAPVEPLPTNAALELSALPEHRLSADSPLWRWRPLEQSAPHWLRFDAFASAALESRWRGRSCVLPVLPVGTLVEGSVDLQAMTAKATVDGISVDLALQRCTAGACAYERATADISLVSAANAVRSARGFQNAAVSEGASQAAQRAVAYTGVVRARPQSVWEWCASANGHGTWRNYAAHLSNQMEAGFQRRSPSVMLTIDGVAYEVDLELMVQINCQTKYRRLVRRSQPLP